MSEKAQNVQDVFLNHLRKNKTPVTIFLVNGVKLQGSSPGSTISACCCAAMGIRSLSTSTRSRPSCRSRRSSCSTGTRPRPQADLNDDIELNGHDKRQAHAAGDHATGDRGRGAVPFMSSRQQRAKSATARPSSRRRSALRARSTSTSGWPQTAPLRRITPATLIGKGVVERIKACRGARHRPGDRRRQADAGAAAQPRKGLADQGHRPHRADPRDFRRPRPHARRPPAGRTGGARLSARPAGAVVDPSWNASAAASASSAAPANPRSRSTAA